MMVMPLGPDVDVRDPGLTPAGVRCIYETLLGRSPSADEVTAQLAATTEWSVLLRAVAESDEYRAARAMSGHRTDDVGTPRVNTWHPDLARFSHPEGMWSLDGEAVVGQEGWIFLGRGTNAVLEQHQPDFVLPADWADRWRDAVRVRRDEARELSVTLMLLVVPDKLSVMGDRLPKGVALRSRPPAAVLSHDLELGVVYPVEQLSAVTGGAYLRTDTHLSLAGNRTLASIVLSALSDSDRPWAGTMQPGVQFASYGDLGRRFEPPVVEVITTLNSLGGAVIVADNHAEVSGAGRHVGVRRVLRNTTAPDPRTVVVFGDSYSFPSLSYQSPAWFMAQEFREVHFVWSPFGWDREYVEQVRAGVVVCETAERFVPRPPLLRIDVAALTRAAVAAA